MEENRNDKKISINKKLGITLGILVAIIVIAFLIYMTISERSRTMSYGSKERLAYLNLKIAALGSAIGNDNTSFTKDNMINLKKFIMKVYPNSQWFLRDSGTFYADTKDANGTEITWISDGTYTATLYVNPKSSSIWCDYILQNYKYEKKFTKGYEIYIGTEDNSIKIEDEQTIEKNTIETSPNSSADNDSDVSVSQRNAISKAKSYLSHSAFSYEGLIEQLEYEKFNHDDSVYAVDNCGANWNEQALKKAKSYLKNSAFSYDGLIEQLEYEKFSHEESVYAVDNCGANWEEQAAKKS